MKDLLLPLQIPAVSDFRQLLGRLEADGDCTDVTLVQEDKIEKHTKKTIKPIKIKRKLK